MKMYQLEAEHPTVPGVINSTSFSRAEVERDGVECLRMIGDALIDRLENYGVDTAEEKREAWAALRDRDDVPFVAFATFVAAIQPTDGPEQRDNLEYRCVINEIDVEVSQRAEVATTIYLIRAFLPGRQGLQTTMACANAATAAARAKEFVCEIGEHMIEHAPQGSVNGWDIAKMNDWEGALAFLRETWPNMGFDVDVQEQAVEDMFPAEFITAPTNRADQLESIMCGPGRDHVQPLDPADLVVSTLVRNLANIEARAASTDEVGAQVTLDQILAEAAQAMEAGQAWLDKARPVGKIADDVVRLAGIIVAGTELHANLSEAMDLHIYDEHDERDPDCGYAAALKGWTDALAGIAVTTFAPPTPPEAPEEEPKAACLRAGLLAFPDIPVFTLSIAMWPIPEHVMFPDDMLDTPLDGLKVADAQRLLAEQVIPDQKPN